MCVCLVLSFALSLLPKHSTDIGINVCVYDLVRLNEDCQLRVSGVLAKRVKSCVCFFEIYIITLKVLLFVLLNAAA